LASVTYTDGFDVKENLPFKRIPPTFGKGSLRHTWKKLTSTFYVNYNGWKSIENYSSSSNDREEYATVDGTPAWITYNFSTYFQVNPTLAVSLGLENISDLHYRVFSSGVSSPGRNFFFSLNSNF